jgi:hypothetical protein
MSWIDDELSKRRLDEKKSSNIGTVKRFVARVRVDGTLMSTAVFAENQRRARTIAKKLFGDDNVRGMPVEK